MVDLIFTKIHAERFLSFPKLILEKHELIHPHAVYSIRGRDPELNTENAVGKSTIERMKFYGLYGQDLYASMRSDLLSNFNIDGGHFVEIHFTLGGNDFMIQRFHDFVPYEGGPVLEDSEKKTRYKGVRFYHVSGHELRPIRGGSDTETQEIINKTLKLGPDAARSIFFIPQGVESPLLKANASATQDILMELFPLEFVDKGRELNKEIMKDKKDSLLIMENSLSLKAGLLKSKEQDFSNLRKSEYLHAEDHEKATAIIKKNLLDAKNKTELLAANAASLGDTDSIGLELKERTEKVDLIKNSAEIQTLKAEYLAKREQWANVAEEVSQQKTLLKDPEIQLSLAQEFLKNTDLAAASLKMKSLNEELEQSRAASKEAELKLAEIERRLKENSESQKRILMANSYISQRGSSVDELLHSLGLNRDSNLSIEKSTMDLRGEIDALKVSHASLKEKHTEISTTLKVKKAEFEKIGKEEVCHACNRPFDKNHDHESVKNSLALEIDKLNAELELISAQGRDSQTRLLSLEGQFITNEKKEKASILLLEIKKLEEELSEINYDADLDEKLMKEKIALQSIRTVSDIEKDLKLSQDLLSKYETASKKVAELTETIKNVHLAIKSREEKLGEIKSEGEKLKKEIEESEVSSKAEIEKIQQEIKTINERLTIASKARSDVEAAKNVEAELSKELSRKMIEKNPYTELIERSSNEVKELSREKSEIEERIKEANKDLLMYKFIDEMLSQNGIKSFVVDDTTEILNELIQENLKKFGFDGVLSVEFLPESVTAKGVVKSEIKKVFKLNGREAAWDNFSGGQKARLSFCTNVAIRLIGEEKSGVLYHNPTFDEPFEGLCSTSQQIAMKIFMDLALSRTGISIITHDRGLQSMFSGTLWLLKKGDFSYKVNKDIFEHPMSFRPKVEETYGDRKRVRRTSKKTSADQQIECDEREVS